MGKKTFFFCETDPRCVRRQYSLEGVLVKRREKDTKYVVRGSNSCPTVEQKPTFGDTSARGFGSFCGCRYCRHWR